MLIIQIILILRFHLELALLGALQLPLRDPRAEARDTVGEILVAPVRADGLPPDAVVAPIIVVKQVAAEAHDGKLAGVEQHRSDRAREEQHDRPVDATDERLAGGGGGAGEDALRQNGELFRREDGRAGERCVRRDDNVTTAEPKTAGERCDRRNGCGTCSDGKTVEIRRMNEATKRAITTMASQMRSLGAGVTIASMNMKTTTWGGEEGVATAATAATVETKATELQHV